MPRSPVTGPVVIPNCVETRLNFYTSGRGYSVIFAGQVTGSITVDAALATSLFNDAVSAWTSSALDSAISTGAQFSSVEVKDLRSPNMSSYKSTGAGHPGTGAGAPASLNDALVVTKRTAKSGKAYRGRAYFAGFLAASQSSPTHWDDVTGAKCVAFCNALKTAWGNHGLTMCLAQRHLAAGTDIHGNPLAERVANTEPITAFEVANARIDSQRRRLGR